MFERMERRFDMSDFEQSLKDYADQFKLTPSRRVWNGIYNNLHPGSKWPSVTVAIVFIITLITIGNLNNSPLPDKKSQTTGVNTDSEIKSLVNNNTNPVESNNSVSIASDYTIPAYPNYIADDNNLSDNLIEQKKSGIRLSKNQNIPILKISKLLANIPAVSAKGKINSANNLNQFLVPDPLAENDKSFTNNIDAITYFIIKENQLKNKEEYNNRLNEEYNIISNELNPPLPEQIFSFVQFTPEKITWDMIKNEQAVTANTSLLNEQKSNSNSLLNHRKKNKNINWAYYLAPSISSASFKGRNIRSVTIPNFIVLQNRSFHGMTYNPALGLEAGAQMNYNLSKNWNFITGADIQYSGYNIVSNLVHPTFATLTLNDANGSEYSKNYITHYGNGSSQNQISLLNYSLQASIPVGIQYNIWENEKIQINLASTIELSAVLKSNAFMMSSDERYYIEDPSLIRKTNMGTNFNPNIVFIGQKVKWHVGPNIHYQLFSTYKNNYLIKEHLMDYGIRIGISKSKQ